MEWMRDVWLMMRDQTVRAFTVVYVTLYVVALVFIALVFLKFVVAPLGPAITFFLVLGFTVHSIEKGWAVMSLGGIVLYLASFPAYKMWGVPLSMIILMLGGGLWFWAVFRSLTEPKRRLGIMK